jgi:hypothetical protein
MYTDTISIIFASSQLSLKVLRRDNRGKSIQENHLGK